MSGKEATSPKFSSQMGAFNGVDAWEKNTISAGNKDGKDISTDGMFTGPSKDSRKGYQDMM